MSNTASLVIKIVPPPLPSMSPDGSASAAPGGPKLVTTAGTWGWSTPATGRPKEYNVLLNLAAVGIGTNMQVANGGKLYVNTLNSGWYLWNNGFSSSPDPSSPPPPPPPPATPIGIVATPATPTVADTTLAGAVATKITVIMSDGSPFAGSLALSGPGAGLFTISGMNIVTARALTPADDGTQSITVSATQGGAAVSARIL